MKNWRFFILTCLISSLSSAQNIVNSEKMQGFGDAKLGIFIHWGMYAVDGTSESWSFHNGEVTYDKYMNQMKRFTASHFNTESWVDLITESGAKYVVTTFKHHDGLALWNTQQLTPNIPKSVWDSCFPTIKYPSGKNTLWNSKKPLSTVYQTPSKADLMSLFEKSVRARGLKFGAYYSLLDWSHPDYPNFLKNKTKYQFTVYSPRWTNFLNFMHNQLAEINQQFKPDLFWFDGDWEHTESEWNAEKIDSIIHTSNPNAIFNGRLLTYSDYDTPEQNMPIVRPNKKYWELCMTSNYNWGYRPSDTNYKTPFEVLTIFTECLNMGGNLLLDIAPKEDGTIPIEQANLLKEIGRWTKKHSEAIYGTTAGLPFGHYHGNSTLSKDSTCIYLFVNNSSLQEKSTDKVSFQLKGLKNKIIRATVLGSDAPVSSKIVGKIGWSHVPGTLFFEVEENKLDNEITVIKLQLDKKLELYRGQGGFH